jgi:hypothetical protein
MPKHFATLDDAPKIARQFAANLLEEIGAAKVRLAAHLNSKQSHPDVCHSHDFCDANMTMDDAFETLGFATFADSEDSETLTEQICTVWNAAWSIAKSAEFDLSKLDASK